MADNREALAAAQFGIESEYIDIWGHRHSPSEQAIRLIMSAKPSSAEQASPLDPALVVREDAETIPLRVPADRSGASIKLEIRWEGGDLEHHWFFLPELLTVDNEKRLPLPKPLRLGYHEIKVYWVNQPELTTMAQSRFIVCPTRAPSPKGRLAGVALSLYGLRSARNWGCGDVTDLYAAIDFCARAGAAFVALNPLHAIANRQPYNTSPYLPQSSLYRNFLYLDVEKTPGFVKQDSLDREIEELRETELVEYERVARVKLTALAPAFDRFQKSGGSAGFSAYVESEGTALNDFAVYCTLDETLHARNPNVWIWTDWPPEYQDPRSPAVAEFAREHTARVLFFKFLQWQLDQQFAGAQAYALQRGMPIGLYHDLALATDRFGADLWAHREFYISGCRVGAPPDDFAPNGQDWGFPPPNREAHRANGYRLFAQSIRNSARHGGALRIDHVMRFFRLYWIPDALPATDGVYVRDFVEDLLGVLTLESVRQGFIVVGEDLGTVAPEVRHRLSQSGILGYRLLWFERNGDGSFRQPGDYTAQAAVSTTTHDLPTLAGFFTGRDIEARRSAGLIDQSAYAAQWDSRHQEIQRLNQALGWAGFPGDPLGYLLSTPCDLAILNQEDLTGETDQQNLPASTWQYPNWRRKMRVPVEELGKLEDELKRRIEHSGREVIQVLS
jgi:4-alpha-glucanotransferase